MSISYIPGNGSYIDASESAGVIHHHVLSVLVENRAGVLARIAQLFSRRGYNIFSLAVAPTDDSRFSRITIVVDVDSAPLEQITKQLHKLINVIKISELDPADSVECELLVAWLARGQNSQLVNTHIDNLAVKKRDKLHDMTTRGDIGIHRRNQQLTFN